MGFHKLTNRYLGIHTDGIKCLNLWQMVAKIIEEYFSKSVTVTQITQTEKNTYLWGLKNLQMDT